MRRTIGIGVIGMGWMGDAHSRSIEAAGFLTAIATGQPAAPSFEDTAAVARVQQAIAASRASDGWQSVREA